MISYAEDCSVDADIKSDQVHASWQTMANVYDPLVCGLWLETMMHLLYMYSSKRNVNSDDSFESVSYWN